MKILGIESSSVCASCAIFDDDKMLAEYSQCHKNTHSEKLMPMVIRVLEDAKMEVEDIDYIAISKGPGSYTGLRIGAAIAKGLALAKNIDIVAPKSMEVLAMNVSSSSDVIVAITDANKGRCYAGIYKIGEEFEVVVEQNAYEIKDFIEIVNNLDTEIVLVGDCVHNNREYFENELKIKYKIAKYSDSVLKASSVCNRALQMIEKGDIEDRMKFAPSYLRPSQAERMRDERNKN